MTNEAGNIERKIGPGAEISAEWLNRLEQALLRRVVGQDPIAVQATSRGLVISWTPPGKGRQASSAVFPAIVTQITELPDNQIKIDAYDNGFDADPTRQGLLATLVTNGDQPPDIGQKVSAYTDRGLNYVIWFLPPGGLIYTAKITNASVGGNDLVIQCDIYANGFAGVPTQTGVIAHVIDLLSIAFQVNDQISVFQSAQRFIFLLGKCDRIFFHPG